MGSKTPLSIKKEVIRRWLKGHSRDQIAKEVDIGAGTVSLIIKECRQDDPDFDLLREVAFIIKNESMDLNFLASSIRLRRVLEDNGLNEEQMESFIEKIEVHCFKRSLKVDEFINLISNISDISNNLNMAIDSLPEYVSQQKSVLYEIVDKVVNLKMEKEDLLEEKKLTVDILMDYEKNRPVAEKLVVTQMELEDITRQRDTLENEITTKGWELHKLKYEQQVPTDQLDIVNKKLNVPTDPEELADLMKDFRQHLGKYPDVINFMRERRRYSYFDLTKYIDSLYMSALSKPSICCGIKVM